MSEGIPGYTGPGGDTSTGQEKERKANAMSGKDLVLTGVVVAVMLVGFWFLSDWMRSSSSESDESTAEEQDDNFNAYVMTQVFAERHLRAPATADWPTTRNARIQRHPSGGWLVNTYVDAQNAFGAEIRNRVTAVVRHTGGTNWKCDYLEIEGQVFISKMDSGGT